MIRWIVTPPAFPLIVRPFATNRAEHVATKDKGTETFHCSLRESVIKASITTFFAQHLTERPRGEKPLKDFLTSNTKRVV